MSKSTLDTFIEAYNNFDHRPLKGESLRKFYAEDLASDIANSVIKAVQITERFRKILLIGHTGCGKSTILNKIADELKDQYHVLSFSVADELNLIDIEIIDVLLVIYMKLISFMRDIGMDTAWKRIEELMDYIKKTLKITEIGFDILKSVSFKLKVESESRDAIRRSFKTRVETLQRNISDCCKAISGHREPFFCVDEDCLRKLSLAGMDANLITKLRPLMLRRYRNRSDLDRDFQETTGAEKYKYFKSMIILTPVPSQKDILIIIDDLDKIKNEFAERIFIQENHLLTMSEAKIIFTFPLVNYYSPSFIDITDKFTHEFIQLKSLYTRNRDYQEPSLRILKELVLKRINKDLIEHEALKFLIDQSGGLLRDLIKFMQDACKIAIDLQVPVIDQAISKRVILDKINEYNRLFNFPKYENAIQKIMKTRSKDQIENSDLIYLLRYLFVLEYGSSEETSWYDAHPCLKECVTRTL